MKQTSSALTFLMAQYRAIFKRAYVKGIATAVLLTAGLAAGQAQAAISGSLGSGASTINAETGVVTVNAGNIVASGADNTLSGNETNKYVNDITVEAGGSLTISGTILQGGVLTANSDSTLNISGDIVGDSVDGQGGGDASEWTASFKADSATVNVSGTVQTGAIQLDNTKLTIGKSSSVSAHNQGAYVIGGFGDGDKNVIAATNSVITFQDYGFLQSNDRLIVQDSTLNFNGAKPKSQEDGQQTLDVNEVANFETAFIRGRDGVELTNTKIVVGDNKKGGIYGPTTALTGGSIVVGSSGEFVFDGDWNGFNTPTNGQDTYSHAAGAISLNDVDITNAGTLTIGGTDHLANLTLTDGSMENTGTVNIYTDKLSVSEDYFNGLFTGESSKVTFGGSAINVDGEVDLNNLGIIGTNGALSGDKLTISNTSGATLTAGTINLDKAYKASSLSLDAGTLNIDTGANNNKFTLSSGSITVRDELNGSASDGRVIIQASVTTDTASLNLVAGANGGVINNIDRFNIGWSSKSSGSSQLTVDGNWDFNDARLTVSSGGELTINGTATDVDSLMMQADGKVTIATNGAMTIQRLLGAEADSSGSIDLNGSLTVVGDGDLTDDGQPVNNIYYNDVQLTNTTVNINNGGTLAITGEDAVEDIFKVNTSGGTITGIEVVTSGGKSGDFGGWDKSKVNLLAGGTLKIDLAAVDSNFTSIDSGALNKLKGDLVADPSKGSFDFGNIDIALSQDVTEAISGGSIGYDTLVSGGVNNVQGIDELQGLTVAVDTSKNSSINLSMGASSVELTGSNQVNVEGSLILANNSADGDHSFVYQAATTEGGEAKIASVTVAKDSGVNLTGAGTIGSLTKSGNVTGTSAVLTAGEGATQTVAGKIDLETVTIGTGTVTVADDIKATNLTLTGDLVNTAESGANTLEAAKLTQAQGTTLTADELTLGATDSGTASTVQGTIVADTIAINKATTGSNTLTIAGGSTVTSNTFEAASGVHVYVGLDGDNSSAGSLSVTTMDLNGADLIVDPEFGTKSSFVGVKGFYDSKNDYEAGMLDGNAYALKNAILSIGDENEANVRALFADYLDEHNSLSASGVGAIVYVAKNMGVADTHKIVVDPAAKLDANGKLDTTEYTADLTIRNGGALAIDVTAAAKNDGTAALNFAQKGAEIEAGTSAKILLTGDYTQYDTLTLFKDGDGDGLTFTQDSAQSITVETLNGLLQGTYSGTGGSFDIDSMTLQTERVKTAYTDTSSAVRNSIISYVARDTDWANQDDPEHDIDASRIHGAYVADVKYRDGKYYSVDGEVETEITDQKILDGLTFVKVKNPDYDKTVQGSQEYVYLAYEKAANAFLDAVAHDTLSGNAADSAAHMADFAGVAQVALKAGASTYEAISGRMGMGAENTSMTFANNGQGAGIWLTPIYQTSDSDGFEAQGVDYGADIDLYGIALGGDYTLANGVRIGAMFNVGSGDADGQGAGSSVTSDFDYYGFGLYAGYSVGQFSVVGDVSYTAVDNDVEANTNIDKLETSLDSSNLSVGVTGAYAFETAAGVTVTPHIGLRYSNIDIDDYSVKGKTYGTVGDYSADSLSVFSIPVGVTIASEFQAGTWSVKPSFDVTLTGNFGDDEAEGTFHWAGVENIDSSLNSEIFDNFTYGASLGIAAQSSSGISLGVTVGYTGSSNVDDFGVNANARFTF